MRGNEVGWVAAHWWLWEQCVWPPEESSARKCRENVYSKESNLVLCPPALPCFSLRGEETHVNGDLGDRACSVWSFSLSPDSHRNLRPSTERKTVLLILPSNLNDVFEELAQYWGTG